MTNQKLNSKKIFPIGDYSMKTFEKDFHLEKLNSFQEKYERDIFSTFTSVTKLCLDLMNLSLQKVRKYRPLRVFSRTVQPFCAASVILVTILLITFYFGDRRSTFLASRSRFTYLTYFTAFSLHVGSQFWMTFVSGLSLYFNLARHAFGEVQKILFPKYFTLNCALSAVTVVQFGRLYASKGSDFHVLLQLLSLFTCFAIEFYTRIYLIPLILELISSKTTIEKAAGMGQEIGHHELGPLLQCPHYMSIYKSFRKVHMYTATGNFIAIMCSAFHLYFLAYKWTDKLI